MQPTILPPTPPLTFCANRCVGKCPSPYHGECVCDLRRFSAAHSDWPIARLTGVATYAQLVDAGPGLFEPFADYRTRGDTASSISSLTLEKDHYYCDGVLVDSGWLTKEEGAPPPPNLASTIIVDGISIADVKRLLIRAVTGVEVSPIIEPLVGSSLSYRSPELTLGDVATSFVVLAVLVSIFVGFAIRSYANVLKCAI